MPWSRGLARSRDRLKPLYLHWHNVYGHQTCSDGDIPCQTVNHKVIRNFEHVILQGHVTKKSFISLLYFYYGKQTWQNDDFAWWVPTYNVTWPFDHVALWDLRFTYRRSFSMQMLKLSPTCCFDLFHCVQRSINLN